MIEQLIAVAMRYPENEWSNEDAITDTSSRHRSGMTFNIDSAMWGPSLRNQNIKISARNIDSPKKKIPDTPETSIPTLVVAKVATCDAISDDEDCNACFTLGGNFW